METNNIVFDNFALTAKIFNLEQINERSMIPDYECYNPISKSVIELTKQIELKMSSFILPDIHPNTYVCVKYRLYRVIFLNIILEADCVLVLYMEHCKFFWLCFGAKYVHFLFIFLQKSETRANKLSNFLVYKGNLLKVRNLKKNALFRIQKYSLCQNFTVLCIEIAEFFIKKTC